MRRVRVGRLVLRTQTDKHGVLRFRRNRIIDDLVGGKLDPKDGYCLNTIAMKIADGSYTAEEGREVMALLGYSISGFLNLSINRRAKVVDVEVIDVED